MNQRSGLPLIGVERVRLRNVAKLFEITAANQHTSEVETLL